MTYILLSWIVIMLVPGYLAVMMWLDAAKQSRTREHIEQTLGISMEGKKH